jgi:prevent-host-death family protein
MWVQIMKKVNIHEAKTQLSKLIASGEEVVIARNGEPVARLLPIKPPVFRREPGSAAGILSVPPEFFEQLPEKILEGFETKSVDCGKSEK